MNETLKKLINPQKRNILIIEDDTSNLELMASYLEVYGFEIMMARDGESGFEKARYAELPDIILLDVVMSEMDGFDTCRRLKSDKITQDIPIIFMTGLDSTEDKVKGFEVGAVDYITKPIQRKELIARVTNHLRIRDLTQRLQEQNLHLQKKTLQLETISQVGQQLISVLNLHELLEKVATLIQAKFDYYFVGVWLLDKTQAQAQANLVLQTGVKRGETKPFEAGLVVSITAVNLIIVSAYQTGRCYLFNELKPDAQYFDREKLPDTQAELALPLQVGEEILGVLDIHSDQPNAFEVEDITALQSLADEIAIAIRNARLYELEGSIRRMEEEKSHKLAELKILFSPLSPTTSRGHFNPCLSWLNYCLPK